MPLIRPSRDEDLPAIAAIYGHHVTHGTASFELEPPSLADVRADVVRRIVARESRELARKAGEQKLAALRALPREQILATSVAAMKAVSVFSPLAPVSSAAASFAHLTIKCPSFLGT